MLAVLLGLLLASTWAQDSSIATSDATTPEATETVSLWLPMNGPADLSIQASIVSAVRLKALVIARSTTKSDARLRTRSPTSSNANQTIATFCVAHTTRPSRSRKARAPSISSTPTSEIRRCQNLPYLISSTNKLSQRRNSHPHQTHHRPM
jgi:hypothetical protein